MDKRLIYKQLAALVWVLSVGQTPSLTAQIKYNFEVKKAIISLPDTNYHLEYVSVLNTEGLKFLADNMKDNAVNFPLMLVKKSESEPLKKIFDTYESIKPQQKEADQATKELLKICDQKEQAYHGLIAVKDTNIAQLKQHNKDLMNINKEYAEQYKAAISTAKDANKGWSWQGIKDLVLGTAAGLAIGLLIGLTHK